MARRTIFALSSGPPPAGIAVIRISGPEAAEALSALTNQDLPKPRSATLRFLFDPKNQTLLDQALVLYFPKPMSVTGEDVVELHLHGGRAVVGATLDALVHLAGLRPANAGDFTRRAFENGQIDLATAEGLSDLLSAETEAQHKNAIAQVGGSLHRLIDVWVGDLLRMSAWVEASIDFNDEDDVGQLSREHLRHSLEMITDDIAQKLANPPAERLYAGVRVAIVGPANAGKSTLLNRLINRDAAIVSDQPGTTRDAIEAFVKLGATPLIFIDTAGFRSTNDRIEQLGIARSEKEVEAADIILALGGWSRHQTAAKIIEVSAKCDVTKTSRGLPVSAVTGQGMELLIETILSAAASLLPSQNEVALNARHRFYLKQVQQELEAASILSDELLVAEHLRRARDGLNQIAGGTDTEAMLDALFGTFCIGK